MVEILDLARCVDAPAVDNAHGHDDDYFRPIRLNRSGCADNEAAPHDLLDNIPVHEKKNDIIDLNSTHFSPQMQAQVSY